MIDYIDTDIDLYSHYILLQLLYCSKSYTTIYLLVLFFHANILVQNGMNSKR